MNLLRNSILAASCLIGSSGCPAQEKETQTELPSHAVRLCGDTVNYYETRGSIEMCLGDNCLIECREAIREGIQVIMPNE